MNNALIISGELATSVGASTIVATAVNADTLLTALITFGVSLVTLVGGELVKFLVTYLQKKTKELKNDADKKGDEKGNK